MSCPGALHGSTDFQQFVPRNAVGVDPGGMPWRSLSAEGRAPSPAPQSSRSLGLAAGVAPFDPYQYVRWVRWQACAGRQLTGRHRVPVSMVRRFADPDEYAALIRGSR